MPTDTTEKGSNDPGSSCAAAREDGGVRHAAARRAELLRMEDRIGTLEPGKLADLIAVEGNPLEEIRALEADRVVFVMKAGEVYKTPKSPR